ncbi:SDR family oxidoreductase [Microbacterium sp.]|uniref:SDR family oxidoreductase n=1 Tax=Microbacterium sp. TaxID=51671 RepID=UPI003C70B2A7
MNIAERTIFIPGGTSGIGLALARRFQDTGAHVIIGGRRMGLLAELHESEGFDTVEIDVSDDASVAEAAAVVIRQHPSVDTIVAMAGIMVAEDWRFPAAALEIAQRTVQTNVLGPVRLIAGFVEHLRTKTDALIMTVSSGLASVPLAATPTYSASKAYVHMLSESLRLQLADSGVRVVELVPPSVRTDLMPGHQDDPAGMPLDEYVDETMTLLMQADDPHEVLVDRVRMLRFAEVRGEYDRVVATLNANDAHALDPAAGR